MKCGIATEHVQFWKSMPLGELFRTYCALSVASKGDKMLDDITVSSKAEQRVLSYFHQYIANISNKQLCDLLRFITGCDMYWSYIFYVQWFGWTGKTTHEPYL